MGYHPRAYSSKKASREYKKAFQKKKPSNKQVDRQDNRQVWEEKTVFTFQQIFEITLKRLHTLGNQKFGLSPFSEHFDRWLLNVETILNEFENQSDINIDEQFVKERDQVIATIKLQLETRRQQETSLEIRISDIADVKNCLQQTKKEYQTKAVVLRSKKITAVKRLNREMEIIKKEQEQTIKIKPGFFRGITKKEREQKETMVMQRYNDKQQELEIVVLDFKEKQKQLKEDYENKCMPLIEAVKNFQKYTKEMDTDNSLEERWFACETLIDVINNFFQRKVSKQSAT
jgi:regulator of sigma D